MASTALLCAPAADTYFCPNARAPIPRAVHLARLLNAYEACRGCPHRHETAGLNASQVRTVNSLACRAPSASPWHAEGYAGDLNNEFTPSKVRALARAFGCWLWQHRTSTAVPAVVLAGDGRPRLAAHLAAALDGLRWAGCQVIHIHVATAPLVAATVASQAAHGGLLLANAQGPPRAASLSFWAAGGRPLSATHSAAARTLDHDSLDELRDLLARPGGASQLARPARRAPPERHLDAAGPYLDGLAQGAHGLRPLRFVLEAPGETLRPWLAQVLRDTACQIIAAPSDVAPAPPLAETVRRHQAHFGATIDPLGEAIELVDDAGRPVERPALVRLLNPDPPLLCLDAPTRESAFALAAAAAAPLVVAAGRIWTADPNPRSDALALLVALLKRLSHSDASLSSLVRGA